MGLNYETKFLFNLKAKITLASKSSRRRKLLKELGLKFSVIPARVQERLPKRLPAGKAGTRSPKRLAKRLALLKASDVGKRVKDGLIIAADTIVILRGEVIGKPKGYEDAKKILRRLSGSRHRVITGVALVNTKTKRAITFAESTWVKMKTMTPKQISYFAKKHQDKAGAYAVQEEGDDFISDVEGSLSNVIGLPVERLGRVLTQKVV